jgi:hypothetical protein
MSWLDSTDAPILDAQVAKLDRFTSALADGVIDRGELAAQLEALVGAMKAAESELDDAQHAKVTQVLVELTAYNVMKVLHEMAQARTSRR